MKAIKLTLNGGRACHFDNIKSRLSSLHATWSNMLRTEGLKNHVIGAMRSTEITESPDDPNHANPHIHALLLVKFDTPLSEIERLVRRYWPRVIKRNVSKSEKVINHDVSCSVREIKYTESHTAYDVKGWLEYITKGSYDFTKESHTESHKKTSRLYWLAVDQAIKGMRLISLSGDLKEATAKVKDEEAKEKDDELPLTDPTPTHLWSDYRGRFVSLAEADTHDANMTPLVRSSSYISPPPLFGMIARHEIYAQLEHTQKQHYEAMRSRLLSSDNRDLLPIIDELITYNIKKVRDNQAPDHVSFYEAHEVERSSLAKKRSLMIKNDTGSTEGEE